MKPLPSNSVSTAAKQGMHRDSQVISKISPKTRITHILAPEIIKTDEANFRELVQRLTGKPADSKIQREKPSSSPPKEQRTFFPELGKSVESENDIPFLTREKIKEEESGAILGGENSNSFVDLIQFPLLPLKSSHFTKYGGMSLFQ